MKTGKLEKETLESGTQISEGRQEEEADGVQEGSDQAVPAPPVRPVRTADDILDLLKKENSWEQILYQVVALEDMDPWNLDISQLARGFTEYIAPIQELDFRIPAKWVIITSILLRMKSDHIKIMKMDQESADEDFMDLEELEEMAELEMGDEPAIDVDPIDVITKRRPVRRVTIAELVNSLKNVVRAEDRRETRLQMRRDKIKITEEDITKRIDNLYKKIGDMLTVLKESEVKFSKLVGSWKRGEVVDSFLPLVHLDQDKKVTCRQERIFDEIFIKKRPVKEKPSAA